MRYLVLVEIQLRDGIIVGDRAENTWKSEKADVDEHAGKGVENGIEGVSILRRVVLRGTFLGKFGLELRPAIESIETENSQAQQGYEQLPVEIW